MTREETKTLLMAISVTYPTFKPQNLTEAINVWTVMLDDMDYLTMQTALKSYIRSNTNPFAPSISQLMDEARNLVKSDDMEELEAWDMVMMAIRKSAYYSQEEYDKLPEVVQKALGSSERLRSMAINEKFNESVESSNFMRTYKAVRERERKQAMMPPDLKQLIEQKKQDQQLLEVEL